MYNFKPKKQAKTKKVFAFIYNLYNTVWLPLVIGISIMVVTYSWTNKFYFLSGVLFLIEVSLRIRRARFYGSASEWDSRLFG